MKQLVRTGAIIDHKMQKNLAKAYCYGTIVFDDDVKPELKSKEALSKERASFF